LTEEGISRMQGERRVATLLVADLVGSTALGEALDPGGRTLRLEGRAASYSEMVPYGPFQHLVQEWLGLSADQPELGVRISLRRGTEELFGADADSVHHWLGIVLGLTPAAAGAEPRLEVARQRALEAMRALLARLAADGPVVVALDDPYMAEHHLRPALAAATEADLPGDPWRAHAAFSQLLAGRGDVPEARAEIQAAVLIVDRLTATIRDEAAARVPRRFSRPARQA
jgi:hypothetical protein